MYNLAFPKGADIIYQYIVGGYFNHYDMAIELLFYGDGIIDRFAKRSFVSARMHTH